MAGQLALRVGLSDRASFENYYAGDNAEIVHALEELTDSRSGFIVLHGVSGTGKTHLLYAAQRAVAAQAGTASYLAMSDAENLAHQYRFEDLGTLLCVDDIHLAAAAPQREQLLFNLVEHYKENQKALLLASRSAPNLCGFRLKDLVSRLNFSATYRLTPLSDCQKAQAMQLRARCRGFSMPREVIEYVLKTFPRDLSALFSLLDRIDQKSLTEQRRVTIPLIRELAVEFRADAEK